MLGIGGFKILEALHQHIDIYHLNEEHATPLIFALYNKYKTSQEVRKRIVFTTHTPEKKSREGQYPELLEKMGFFDELSIKDIQDMGIMQNEILNPTLLTLQFSKKANTVSKIHQNILHEIWGQTTDMTNLITINNAQNRRFWSDKSLVSALDEHEDYLIVASKKHLKRLLFDIVADQTGKMFDPDILTIVWARQFTEDKRPELIKYDIERFIKLITRSENPIQMIWAGKPHPSDNHAIDMFNELIEFSKHYNQIAILFQHELYLSKALKQGADIWLDTPRGGQELSECHGIGARMNGAINFSIYNGWLLEFTDKGKYDFIFPPVSAYLETDEQDRLDNNHLMDILEHQIIPIYYDHPKEWIDLMKASMTNIIPNFDSGRMAHEYYTLLYDC